MAAPRRPSILLVLLVGLAAVSVALTLLPGHDAPGPVRARLQGAATVLAVAAVAALVATVALRAVGEGMRKRGQARLARAARPVEGAIAAGAIVVAAVALTGNAGSALVSLGLVGFGLTLALQRPLLAIAGWIAIHGARLFREGDRIEVMGIAGDVVQIDLLTTRVWEIGTPGSPLGSGGANTPHRPTGRVVTLSNATFLEHPVANATSDISHVFDEFAVGVAYEADVELARRILLECAKEVLDGEAHARAARDYQRLTQGMDIEANFPREPQVIESLQDSWIELRLRYLVDARQRGATRTRLARTWTDMTRPHSEALPNVYPRVQPQNVGPDGRPRA